MKTIWTLTKVVTSKGENYANTSVRLFKTAEALHKAVKLEVQDMIILEGAHVIMNDYDIALNGCEDKGVWALLRAEKEYTEFTGTIKEIED